MPLHNPEIAQAFEEMADLLDLEGANPFRVRDFRNAARTLRGMRTEASVMLESGEDLTALPGVGADLAGKIAELAESGRLRALDKLQKTIPPIATELLKLPGLGPKRVNALYHELDIHTVEQLHRAALDGRIRALPGFGPKTEAAILQSLKQKRAIPERFPIGAVTGTVAALEAHLKAGPGVSQVVTAGSYRRARETVGDLDILVTARDGKAVVDWFTRFDEVADIVAAGTTRATVILRSGLQVDLRVVGEESYGAALHYFTGSKAHNIAVRRMAQAHGLKLNEYGVYRGDRRVAGADEESVFGAVGLPYIAPELRENRGEIEAAAEGRLPRLIGRGDLHTHSTATDGRNSVREMALAARAHGFDYVAVTEHSRRLTVAHGLTADRLLAQIDEIEKLNAEGPGIAVLKGIEVDILEDGRLDLPDRVLGRLDLVIGAVHSRFQLSRERQTERILRAMDRPHFSILAHPTGRLIPSREPYDIDMPRIIRAARQRGCYLELNANAERLDLHDTHCQMAKAEGVLVAINSDAHRVDGFDDLRFGIAQARRGWLEKKDVLNTRGLADLRKLLARTI